MYLIYEHLTLFKIFTLLIAANLPWRVVGVFSADIKSALNHILLAVACIKKHTSMIVNQIELKFIRKFNTPLIWVWILDILNELLSLILILNFFADKIDDFEGYLLISWFLNISYIHVEFPSYSITIRNLITVKESRCFQKNTYANFVHRLNTHIYYTCSHIIHLIHFFCK